MSPRIAFVEVPCLVKGIAYRGTKSRWHGCIIRTPVQIEEAQGFDDEEALVLSYDRRRPYGQKGKDTIRRASPGLAGALWNPIVCQDWHEGAGGKATFEQLERQPRTGFMKPNPFPPWHKYPEAGGWESYDTVMLKFREVEVDRSDRIRANCARAAETMRVMPDGTLIKKDIEPVWIVRVRDKKVEVDFSRPYPSSLDVGIPFRMDERAQALALAKTMAKETGRKATDSRMRLEKVNPAFLSWTTEAAVLRLLRSCVWTSRYNHRDNLTEGDLDALKATFEDFKRELAPGGSHVTAAALAGNMMRFHDDRLLRAEARLGDWLETMELAVKLGAIPERIGGINPGHLDAEDDEALASFSL